MPDKPRWKIEAQILMRTIRGIDAFEIEDAEGFCHAFEERVRRDQRQECAREYIEETSYYQSDVRRAIENSGKE